MGVVLFWGCVCGREGAGVAAAVVVVVWETLVTVGWWIRGGITGGFEREGLDGVK